MATHQVSLLVLVHLLAMLLMSPVVPAQNQIHANYQKDALYKSKSIPRQDVRLAESYNVSVACRTEIDNLFHTDRKTLKKEIGLALDAFGKPPAGIQQGTFAWLGHYDECMAIEGFNYCLTDFALNTSLFGNATSLSVLPQIDLRWGICPPANCSDGDIFAVLKHLMDATAILDPLLANSSAVSVAGVICSKSPPIPYSAGFICAVVVCCLLAFLMVFGALYDEFRKLAAKYRRGGLDITVLCRLQDDKMDGDDDDELLIVDDGVGPSSSTVSLPKNESLAVRLLMCFALNRNLAKLFDTKQGDSSLRSLNGIRVLSMFWVILGHTALFGPAVNAADNIPTLLDRVENHLSFQALANAFFSVDSFFFLSGFLIAYISFGRFRELNSAKKWGLFYFHRYWRLTPLFAFTILVYMYIPQFFGEGPLWQSSTFRPFCPSYWWSSLLYISNFWPKTFAQECIAWTWYLANDMQFFIISPLLMAPLFYFPVLGWITLIATLIASFITTGVIIGIYDLNVMFLTVPTKNDFSSLVYGKPYCRIAPYLVGIGLGYIMHRIGKRRLRMSPVTALVGWLVAAGLALSVVYGLFPGYKTPLTKAATIVYGSVSRFVWAVALAWVVFACKYGYGGWINSFLSWRGWVPLARVTFSAYMFHPVVIETYFYNFATTYHFSVYLLAFQFAGCLSISYFVAVLVALAVEYPCANLEKILIPVSAQSKKKKKGGYVQVDQNSGVLINGPSDNTNINN